MALRCTLARSLAFAAPPLGSVMPRLPRAVSDARGMSDDTTADMALKALGSGEADVFKDAPEKFEWKPYMYLPTLESLGGGSHHEPLINIPPVEDPLLHFLTSLIMKNGERAKARRIVSRTLLYIFTLTRAPPLPILREAVLLASPAVKTVSQTHGTKVVHVPTALSEKHRTHYGLAWLLAASKARVGRRLEERLAREMVDVVQRTHAARGAPGDMKHPGSLGLKLDMHRLATVNRGSVRIEPGAQRAMAAAAEQSITSSSHASVSSPPESDESAESEPAEDSPIATP